MNQLCKNPKPDGSWCGVPITWGEIEGGKKRPFEVDTGQIHKCPYYKPKFQVPPDVKREFEDIERQVNNSPPSNTSLAEILKVVHEIQTEQKMLSGQITGFFQAWSAENDFKTASDRMKKERK